MRRKPVPAVLKAAKCTLPYANQIDADACPHALAVGRSIEHLRRQVRTSVYSGSAI